MKNLSKNISVYLFSIIFLTQSVSADDQVIPDTVNVTQDQEATEQNQEAPEALKWSFNPQNEEEREANVKILKQTAINGSIATASALVVLGVIYSSQTFVRRLYPSSRNTYYSTGSYNPKYKSYTAANLVKLHITNHPNNLSPKSISEFLTGIPGSEIEGSIRNIFEISGVRNVDQALKELLSIIENIAQAEGNLAQNEKDYFAESSIIESFKLAWAKIELAQEANREYKILKETLKVLFTNTDQSELTILLREFASVLRSQQDKSQTQFAELAVILKEYAEVLTALKSRKSQTP